MSVLLEFAMFPTDKGESVSEYVSRILKMIDESNIPYMLTAMGTIVEVDTIGEALDILHRAYRELEPDCGRIYSSIKVDIRKGKDHRLTQKTESIERRIGRPLKK